MHAVHEAIDAPCPRVDPQYFLLLIAEGVVASALVAAPVVVDLIVADLIALAARRTAGTEEDEGETAGELARTV
jgi:hypothetical protein